jgi:MoxR-like ATPase
MANIAKLPDGLAVIGAYVEGVAAPYGPHLTVERDLADRASLYETAGGKSLALLRSDGKFAVRLTELNPITVPYVNRFLAGTGVVVIKDWRSVTEANPEGSYRLKSRKGGPKVRQAVAATAQPKAAVAAAAPSQHTAEPKHAAGAVITVSGDVERQSSIPGMVYLPKVALKGAGRGNTDCGGIVIPTAQFTVLEDAWHIAQKGKPAAVLLTGPAGTAKTMLVRAFAAYLGVGYLKIDAGAVRTADDWAGAFRQDPNTKTWAHRWSPLALALREGKPCVIHVDELTRTETPAALNAFMGLLDETGTLLVPDANAVLTMPKGILVVATANIGPEFVGTLPLDGAVRQRFPYGVRMATPSEAVESKLLTRRTGISDEVAVALVRMANQQRQHRDDAQQYPSGAIVSTRILLSIAERIAERNADPREAVISTLQAQFDPGDDAALSVVIDAFFPKVAPKVATPDQSGPATIVAERHWFMGPVGTTCEKVLTDGASCSRVLTDPIHFGNNS